MCRKQGDGHGYRTAHIPRPPSRSSPSRKHQPFMSTVRRDFRASPHRTGCETWEAIARVLAPTDGSAGRKELLAVSGIAAQIVSTETAKTYPIISAGSGSQ